VALVRKAADEIRITIFFNSFGVKKIDELVTSNKLKNNFTGLVTSGLRSDLARGPPVGLRSFIGSVRKKVCRMKAVWRHARSLQDCV
jgi:hypothetical protein